MKSKVEEVGTYDDMQTQINNGNFEIVLLPKSQSIGIINARKAIENLSIIVDRAKLALKNEFYIEFISLKIQYLEFYLKMFWVSKHPNNLVLDQNKQKFFGTLINECANFGFDSTLLQKIKDFNDTRIKAIHKYLMGETDEEELKLISLKYSKLGNEVFEYVLNECGVIIRDTKAISQDVGTMFFARQKQTNSSPNTRIGG